MTKVSASGADRQRPAVNTASRRPGEDGFQFTDRLLSERGSKGVSYSGGIMHMCPLDEHHAHSDHKQSLSVKRGYKVPVVLYCHVCRPRFDSGRAMSEAILMKLGTTLAATYDRGKLSRPSRLGRQRKEVFMYWEIKDIGGQVVAVHVRKEFLDGRTKKVFWAKPSWRPELVGRKDLWGLPGGLSKRALPLYGSELLGDAKATEVLFIVEGEKAADALTEFGHLVVATVTGAGQIPNPEVLQVVLRFDEIVTWADADEAGRKHMADVRSALRDLGHANVSFIEWDHAPCDGADVVEAIQYRVVEELIEGRRLEAF